MRLKDAPTNDHPDGRDGWILATGIVLVGPEGPDDPDEIGPEGPDGPGIDPPPVTPPADLTALENTMGAQFIMLMRTVKEFLNP